MYNGIGLDTARGSGTNGFVQRNLSYIKTQKDRIDFKSEDELKKIDSQLMRAPNLEILHHDNKRKIELKCLEMEELMEEQGYSTDEIEKKVSTFRKMLMEKLENSSGKLEFDDQGRLIARATHQISEANQLLNEQLRLAFGISEYFKEGSSLDPDRKNKEKAAEDLALAQKKYNLIKEDESSSESSSSSDDQDVELHSSDLQTTDSEEEQRTKSIDFQLVKKKHSNLETKKSSMEHKGRSRDESETRRRRSTSRNREFSDRKKSRSERFVSKEKQRSRSHSSRRRASRSPKRTEIKKSSRSEISKTSRSEITKSRSEIKKISGPEAKHTIKSEIKKSSSPEIRQSSRSNHKSKNRIKSSKRGE